MDWRDYPIVAFFLLIAVLGTLYGLTNTTVIEVPVVVREPVVIEIPEIITQTRIEIVEVPVIVKEVRNVTIPEIIHEMSPVEIPVVIETTREIYRLRDFENMTELNEFLDIDIVDKADYSLEHFNCMDYALAVINNAAGKGYHVYFFYWWEGDDTAHAMCMAYVRGLSSYVVFDPQNDAVKWTWTAREAIAYG